MISPALRTKAINRVNECVRLIREADPRFASNWGIEDVRFNLRGKSAGQAVIVNCWKYHIRINAGLYAENIDYFINQTIPHEVAHIVVEKFYDGERLPHGAEWKAIMRLMGVTPKRCHKLDVSKHKARRTRKYLYQCGCKEHQLSSTRHRRSMTFRTVYRCKTCREQVQYTGKPSILV